MSSLITWSPGVTLEQIEKQVVLAAFRHFRGVKTTTASALGIAIRTLDNKLEKYADDEVVEQRKVENEYRRQQEYLNRARGIKPAEAKQENDDNTNGGVCVQPVSNVSAESTMPMHERKEVQGVLPSKNASGGFQKRR